MFVYGIGMEDNLEESDKNIAKVLEKRKFDSVSYTHLDVYKRQVL